MTADWARPVVHWELVAKDVAAQSAFYQQLFNWRIEELGFLRNVDPGLGGPEPGPGGHLIQGDQPGFVLYMQVGDLDATLLRAKALGGTVVTEPFDAGGPTVAFITDPEGNRLGVVQQ